jgi:hypothetical protein
MSQRRMTVDELAGIRNAVMAYTGHLESSRQRIKPEIFQI